MASFEFIAPAEVFPAGQAVAVYPEENWATSLYGLPPRGAPPGSSVASGSLSSTRRVTFTGLSDGAPYFVAGQVGSEWRYVGFETPPVVGSVAAATSRALGVTMDGGGSPITTGNKGYVRVPFSGVITGWTLLADVSGSVVVDVWKDTYANYPPTVADTITAAAKPTLSGATKATSSTLTGWTVAVSEGDVIAFNVDSAATITRLVLSLQVTAT